MFYTPAKQTQNGLINNVFLATVEQPESIANSGEGRRACYFIKFNERSFVLRFIDGKEIRPSDGTICLIPPSTPFYITGNDLSKLTCIKCLGTLTESLLKACGVTSPKLTLRPEATNAFQAIISYINEDIKSAENLNRCALALYTLIIETEYASDHLTERKPVIIAQKIRQYIDENIREGVSVTSIARAFYFSETHVIRVFKDMYAETPKQYILRKKIDAAQKMLLDTSLQIKEIAVIFNFADSYHFSHTFKRFTGYSPEKYRMRELSINTK